MLFFRCPHFKPPPSPLFPLSPLFPSHSQSLVRTNKLSENWVAEELNVLDVNGTSRDDFYYYINICVSLVNNQINNVPNGVGVYQVRKCLGMPIGTEN